MDFRYLKYLTGYTNTIVAESPTPFSLGPGEGQIYTNFEIPAVQPLYLYAESGGNVVPNSDSAINAYLASIGESSFENAFTGYTATTETRLIGIEADITYLSGQTAGKVSNTKFNAYTGSTNTRLNTDEANIAYISGQTALRLRTADFNVYSGYTLSLIQASQAGLDLKESVFVATVVDIGATYIPTGGTASTGRFTSAPTTIDGRVLSNGKRILVKNQTDKRQNGIYVVISSGVWNRSSDQDGSTSAEVSAGNYTFVETGSTNVGSGWSVVGSGVLTLNVDPIMWTQFNASTGYIAGTGILITGNTISFNGATVAGNALTWSGTQLNVNPTGGTLGTKFDTKLDITSFNSYSASTLTNINSRLLKTTFNGYTGTTAPATYLSIANFNAYSGSTAVLIGTKLSISTFNTYTGTTLPAAYLSKSAFNAYSATTLTNIQSRLLTTSFNAYSATTLTNIQSRLLTTAFNTYSGNTAVILNTKIDTANNGLTKSGRNVRLGGIMTGSTTIGLGTSNITFTGTTGQLRYGTALGTTTPRTIIDQGYFTGNTLHTSAQILVYSSGTTDINVTTAVSIPLNRLIRNNTSFYTYTGGTAIKILVAGTYDVSYSINATNSNGTVHSVAATIYKNGTTVTETTTSASLAGSTGSGAALTLSPTQVTFAANDIVHLRGFRLIAGGGTVNITANTVFLSIVKKF